MSWWKTKQKSVIRVGACTDVGRIREENQDAFGQFSQNGTSGRDEHLFILADGMGGHVDGREASRLAVEEVHRTFFKSPNEPIGRRLTAALEAANERIVEQSKKRSGAEKMGTTCTALVVRGGKVHIAHVGDSRAYRITRDETLQLTDDHTMVEEMRRQGILTKSEARSHPRRHALTRALGIEPKLQVDLPTPLHVRAEEWYVLCSDGLSQVDDDEIRQIVTAQDPQQACDQLVHLANDRGGQDNVTVIVIKAR